MNCNTNIGKKFSCNYTIKTVSTTDLYDKSDKPDYDLSLIIEYQ